MNWKNLSKNLVLMNGWNLAGSFLWNSGCCSSIFSFLHNMNLKKKYGTGPWEGAFNQLGNKLTIDDDL